MTDDELRALVREAVARRVREEGPHEVLVDVGAHRDVRNASFELLPLNRGSDGDGRCLIEPSVRCNHCGYCLSYGH